MVVYLQLIGEICFTSLFIAVICTDLCFTSIFIAVMSSFMLMC